MIRSIIRFVFKSFFWICAVLGALLVGLALTAYFSETRPSIAPVPDKAVLSLELDGAFVEHGNGNLLQSLFMGKQNSLFDLTHGLYKAANDDRVRGALIYMKTPLLGVAQVQELRGAIHAFRKGGKKVYLYSDTLGYGELGSLPYYMASSCDQVWVQPMGAVGITGISFESPYLKDFFEEMIHVKPEFGFRKEYKSAPEMFTQAHPTEVNTEAMQAIADSIMSQMVSGISKDRDLMPAQVEHLMNEGPYLGPAALKAKLIDRMLYRDEIKDAIRSDLGEGIKLYELINYAKHLEYERAHVQGDRVAVIFDAGMVLRDGLMSDTSDNVINNDDTHHHFMTALKDSDVKAIVYRVNSSGGDPVASDSIAHVIKLAREKYNKPVVVSMSDMAASGGYWISCMANKIVAQPGTLTGSIGVYAGKFSLKGLWEKLGVNWGKVSVGENGDMWSFNQDFTPQAWVRLNAYLDFVYQRFIALVSQGRNMSIEDVEKVAKGRAWTGEQAQALGLVDQLGGLEDAVVLARKEAGLADEAPIVIVPKPTSLAEKVMELVSGEGTLKYDGFLSTFAAPLVSLLQQLNALSKTLSPVYSVEADTVNRQRI